MLVEFADDDLKLIETEEAAITAFPVAVIVDVRQRLSILRAAPDVDTLRNWRSFGLIESEHSADDHIVPLAEQWSMAVRFQSAEGTQRSIVLKIKRKNRVGS